MGSESLRFISIVPSPSQIAAVVRQFVQVPEGVITGFTDSILPTIRDHVPEYTAEIRPFGAVVRKLALLAGTEPFPIAGGIYVDAAVARACLDLGSESPFYRARNFPGAHRVISDTLQELHQARVNLSTTVEEIEDTFLKAKLASLAEIEQAVAVRLRDLGMQRSSEHIIQSLAEVPELDGDSRRMLIFAGEEFSPLKLDWVQWAVQHGLEVTLVTYRHAGNANLFASGPRIARYLGVEPQAVGEGTSFERNLFSEDAQACSEPTVRIASAPDVLAECEWAIRFILDSGPDAEAAIFVRALDDYLPMLNAAAKRFGTQLSVAERLPLLNVPAAQLTLQLLTALGSEDVRDLAFLADLTYIAADSLERDAFVDALRNAHREKFNAWHSLAQKVETLAEKWAWMSEVLKWRREAGVAVTSPEWHERLRNLQAVLPWYDPVDQVPDHVLARDRAANPVILRSVAAFASVDQIEPTGALDLPQFTALAAKLWENAQISLPRRPGGIRVCTQPDQLPEVPTIVVLGMLEGIFPKRRTESPVLDDFDRDALRRAVPEAENLETSHDRARAERDLFYRVCIAAKRTLYLSYPRTEDERDNIPAYYLEVIQRLSPQVEITHHRRRAWFPDQPTLPADRVLSQATAQPAPTVTRAELVTDQARAFIPGQPPKSHRLRDLADVFECPFRYSFCRLRVRANRGGSRWRQLAQLPSEVQLANVDTPEEATARLRQNLDAFLDEHHVDLDTYELQLLRVGGERLIGQWVEREFKARETWPRNGVRANVGFERFNQREKRPSDLVIEDTVPAVSQAEEGPIIHLYRSYVGDTNSELSEKDRFLYGMYQLAFFEPNQRLTIEVDGLNGNRTRYVTHAPVGQAQDAKNRLYRVDMTKGSAEGGRALLQETKAQIAEALRRIRTGEIQPVPGSYCTYCDLVDVCRVVPQDEDQEAGG